MCFCLSCFFWGRSGTWQGGGKKWRNIERNVLFDTMDACCYMCVDTVIDNKPCAGFWQGPASDCRRAGKRGARTFFGHLVALNVG